MTTKVVEMQWNSTDFFIVGMMYRCLTAFCQSLWLWIRLKIRLGLSLYNKKVLGEVWDAEGNVNHWEKQSSCFSPSMPMTTRNILQMFFSCISGWHQYKWRWGEVKTWTSPFSNVPSTTALSVWWKGTLGNEIQLLWAERNKPQTISKWYWPEPQEIKQVTKVNIRNTE